MRPLHKRPEAAKTAPQARRHWPLKTRGDHGVPHPRAARGRPDGEPVALGGVKQRALLALLLLHPNEVVSGAPDRRALGRPAAGDRADRRCTSTSRSCARRSARDVIVTRGTGLRVRGRARRPRSRRFESSVARGARSRRRRAASCSGSARAVARARLGGARRRSHAASGARLEEQRLSALEQRIEADLALGRHAELSASWKALVAEHPLRERLRGQLMLALYRSGRQADALEVYRPPPAPRRGARARAGRRAKAAGAGHP